MTKIQENYNKQKYQREEYVSRINRVIDYIERNIDKELSLENLAKITNFSRFHFHRIFRAMVGETLNQFILRIRLEKAAARLIANPKKSITEIALDSGFSGSRELLCFPETKVLSIYHDDPKITNEDKLRTSVCITIPDDTPVEEFHCFGSK